MVLGIYISETVNRPSLLSKRAKERQTKELSVIILVINETIELSTSLPGFDALIFKRRILILVSKIICSETVDF